MLAQQEAINIWAFYDTDRAGEVPCDTLQRFYLYAVSTGTEFIEISAVDSSKGQVSLAAYGPICDNANQVAQPGPKLKYTRLAARYRLSKEILHDPLVGLTEEEKRMLTEAIREKSGVSLQSFCGALGLKRAA